MKLSVGSLASYLPAARLDAGAAKASAPTRSYTGARLDLDEDDLPTIVTGSPFAPHQLEGSPNLA